MPETQHKSGSHPQSPPRDTTEKARQGTRVLPIPDDSPTVAGMPRKGRGLSDPGDPGIPRPEDDVYGNDPADLSERQPVQEKTRR